MHKSAQPQAALGHERAGCGECEFATDLDILPQCRFVGGIGPCVITCGSRDFSCQHIRSDDRQARASTHCRAGAVPGVADERYPALGPGIHAQLGDRIHVEGVGGVDLREHAG
ncbi:Uncharacterised protein [Mycobacteroides abscessus subsp. abscessus]|nr:Uncharacterised protein [Mycobacteroides abscessus subsp. abscessus]